MTAYIEPIALWENGYAKASVAVYEMKFRTKTYSQAFRDPKSSSSSSSSSSSKEGGGSYITKRSLCAPDYHPTALDMIVPMEKKAKYALTPQLNPQIRLVICVT